MVPVGVERQPHYLHSRWEWNRLETHTQITMTNANSPLNLTYMHVRGYTTLLFKNLPIISGCTCIYNVHGHFLRVVMWKSNFLNTRVEKTLLAQYRTITVDMQCYILNACILLCFLGSVYRLPHLWIGQPGLCLKRRSSWPVARPGVEMGVAERGEMQTSSLLPSGRPCRDTGLHCSSQPGEQCVGRSRIQIENSYMYMQDQFLHMGVIDKLHVYSLGTQHILTNHTHTDPLLKEFPMLYCIRVCTQHMYKNVAS